MRKIALILAMLLIPCVSFAGLLGSSSSTTPVSKEYKQQIGMKYTSQPDGKTSFFQYDLQGRLKKRFRRGEKGDIQLMEYNRYHYSK